MSSIPLTSLSSGNIRSGVYFKKNCVARAMDGIYKVVPGKCEREQKNDPANPDSSHVASQRQTPPSSFCLPPPTVQTPYINQVYKRP